MSPPRRRSSRLAAAAFKSSRATPEMPSVAEGEQENESAHEESAKPSAEHIAANEQQPPTTPIASKLCPSHEEMHPSKYHPTMAPEPSSALRLGFTDVRPGNMNIPSVAQGTPTRTTKIVPVTEFTFRFARGAADVPLSENAQRLMNELREQANKIKADMRAQREADGTDIQERKIAKPKAPSGRFSAAHMAAFKKMDSIEGHASAWRAHRTPPAIKAGIKQSPSKTNLAGTPSSVKPSLKRTLSKADLDSTPQSQAKQSLKRSSSRARLDDETAETEEVNFSVSGRPGIMPKVPSQSTFAKRIKKFQEDDASASRPISRDGTSIPQPKSISKGLTHSQSQSSLARLTSPTKASLGHLATPSKSTISLVTTPSKSELGSLKKSASTTQLISSPSPSKTSELRRRIISPKSFQKVKSILRGQTSGTDEARTALPKPMSQTSQTPGPSRTNKELPPLPLTTPRRKLVKRVAFTPDTKSAVENQNTPSPQKSARSQGVQPIQYPTLDGVLASSSTDDVVYPDLSSLKDITGLQDEKRTALPQSVAGTFSFRSDHTIDFGAASATGFGASPGQTSLRHVRTSVAPVAPKISMPGSFPAPPSPSTHPNKENKEPVFSNIIPGPPHGMPNKKRHRAASEEHDLDQEGADRGAKKRKNEHVPESKTLFRSRSVSSTALNSAKKLQSGRTPLRAPSRTPGSASPTKKKGGLSMSRLNMLARPKHRA